MSSPSLSQVMLRDDYWRNYCASQVDEYKFGVEWAPGDGSLTELLVEKWEYLLGLELDRGLCMKLQSQFSGNKMAVVRADITDYPLPERSVTYPVVGNLPYHATGELLYKLARERSQFSQFGGLVQWEVAQRIDANPGESNFRSISLLMDWAFDVSVAFKVPRDAFKPVPRVDSGWINLKPLKKPYEIEHVSQVIRRCFREPRKTLLNNLSESSETKKYWKNWMRETDWDPKRRPQTLTPEDLEEVLEAWK